MTYEIKFKNNYIQPPVRTVSSGISPTFDYIPDTSIQEYISDNERSDGGFMSIPLYNRVQYVNIPPNSILTLTTEDAGEATYYASLDLNEGKISVSPDPISGEGGGGGETGELGRRLLERDFENGKITIPADVKITHASLTIDPNMYQVEFESDESFYDESFYDTYSVFGSHYVMDDMRSELYDTIPESIPTDEINQNGYFYNNYLIYVNSISSIIHYIVTERVTPFTISVEWSGGDITDISPVFMCKEIDIVAWKGAVADTFSISSDSVLESMSIIPYDVGSYQINEQIEDPIKTSIFYNVDKETGIIKSSICSDIDYIPGESYVSLKSAEIENTRGSSKHEFSIPQEMLDLIPKRDEQGKKGSSGAKAPVGSSYYIFDDGTNFTEITSYEDLADAVDDEKQRANIFTKTNITGRSGGTLYIQSWGFQNIYKMIPYIEFIEGKYFLYTGE
jgi:hypothetical protein